MELPVQYWRGIAVCIGASFVESAEVDKRVFVSPHWWAKWFSGSQSHCKISYIYYLNIILHKNTVFITVTEVLETILSSTTETQLGFSTLIIIIMWKERFSVFMTLVQKVKIIELECTRIIGDVFIFASCCVSYIKGMYIRELSVTMVDYKTDIKIFDIWCIYISLHVLIWRDHHRVVCEYISVIIELPIKMDPFFYIYQ
jgi:hypothetical protein